MKTIYLEIIIIILLIIIGINYYALVDSFIYDIKRAIGISTIFGMNFGLYFSFFKNRSILAKEKYDNFEIGVSNWLYFLLLNSIISLIIIWGYKIGYLINIKPVVIYCLSFLAILANYNSLLDFRWLNTNIKINKTMNQIKFNRFAGKILFTLSLLGLILTVFSSYNLGVYILFSVIILSTLFTYIYKNRLQLSN